MDKVFVSDDGSVYKCFAHNFETSSIDEWYSHKLNSPHYDEGVSSCIYCKKPVEFNSIIQKSMEYLVPAICPECAPNNETVPNCKIIGDINE